MVFYNWNHDSYSPYVKEQIENNLKCLDGLEDMVNDKYIRFLLDCYSLEEIEKFDLKTLTEVFLNYFKGDEFEKEFAQGFEALKNMDFTRFWEEHCLPVLNNLCNRLNLLLEGIDISISSLLADIEKLKPDEKIEDIKIYTAYFPYGVSMNLSASSYLTNAGVNGEEINITSVLRLLAHELIHGFPSKKIKDIYIKTCEEDKFLIKSKDVLYNKKASSNGEEEYIVALEHYISLKNGLMTKKEAYESIFSWYESCMPIAVIIFYELVKLNEIPEDINSWIYDLFASETIKIGEVEIKVNEILPGYVDNFMNVWFKD